MNQLGGGGAGGTPTFDTMKEIKREWLLEGSPLVPTAGTSSSSSTAGNYVSVETGEEDEEMDEMNGFLINSVLEVDDDDVQEDDQDDEEGEGELGQGNQDYPPNYGGPRSEVEKLRSELSQVKENYEEKVKQLEEALAESEEDRMHARIILQYEKDEKERVVKLLYDEQRKTRQLRNKLNTLFGVRKDLSEGGGEEDDVTCLGTVVRRDSGGNGAAPTEIISRPVIDRTKVYATNRNNVGGGGGGALSSAGPQTQQQQQRSTQIIKPLVAGRPKVGRPSGSGVRPMSRKQGAPAPPPPVQQRSSQITETERANLTRKVYRGIGTLSRPRAVPQSQPEPSTSQEAAVGASAQPSASASTSSTVKTEFSRNFQPRRPYKKRGFRKSRPCVTAERDAAYFKRNKDKSNFPCNMCPQRFLKLSLLKYHKRQSHHVEDLSLEGVGCVECGFVFPDRKRLFDHRLEAHNIPHPLRSSQGSSE